MSIPLDRSSSPRSNSTRFFFPSMPINSSYSQFSQKVLYWEFSQILSWTLCVILYCHSFLEKSSKTDFTNFVKFMTLIFVTLSYHWFRRAMKQSNICMSTNTLTLILWPSNIPHMYCSKLLYTVYLSYIIL